MIHKFLFELSHALKHKNFLSYYNMAKRQEYASYKKLKQNQEEKLQKLIHFSYNNVPYYHRLFKISV